MTFITGIYFQFTMVFENLIPELNTSYDEVLKSRRKRNHGTFNIQAGFSIELKKSLKKFFSIFFIFHYF